MFLQKIKKLAIEWSCPLDSLTEVATQSLFYGMGLVRTPSPLKKELRKVKIDTRLAKPLWSGNAYLLSTLPQVLCDKKKKIVCLEDFHFARKVLSTKHLGLLQKKLNNQCDISREDLIKELMPEVRRRSAKGRFLLHFDRKFSKSQDIEHDLVVRTLEIVNKEYCNFKSKNREDIIKYLTYCLRKKAATYLKEQAPKMQRVFISEDTHLEQIVHDELELNFVEQDFSMLEMKEDLKRILSPKVYRGIALLGGFPDIVDHKGFDFYLSQKNRTRANLNQTQLKNHIEKYLNYPIFEKVFESDKLRNFLINRMQKTDFQQEGVIA